MKRCLSNCWPMLLVSAFICSASSAYGQVYWNVFNVEGESTISADFVTYNTLADMLTDANRTGLSTVGGFGRNIVGSGAMIALEPTVAPEPGSAVLLSLGILGLIASGGRGIVFVLRSPFGRSAS